MKNDIVLLTDFGLSTGYVGAMYGVIRSVDRELSVFDLTHEVRPFDVRQASDLLASTCRFWPEGTVFVSVVDPGVGTARRASVCRLRSGSFIVTPDNGTLTGMRDEILEIREIDESINRRPGSENESTFHGRDIFAYCAARLASGIIRFEEVGEEYGTGEIVTLKRPVPEVGAGTVHCVIGGAESNFGGISLELTAEEFSHSGIGYGDMTRVRIADPDGQTAFDGRILCAPSFGFVGDGEPVLYHGSTGPYMFISLNRRSFAHTYLPGLFVPGTRFGEYEVMITRAENTGESGAAAGGGQV